MNTKEIAALRRQLKKDNKEFAITQVATAYYAMENDSPILKTFAIRDFSDFSEAEQTLYLKMFKKVLSGKPGRQLHEFTFQTASPRRQQLYELDQNQLKSEPMVKTFLDQIVQGTSYLNGICISLASCEWQVPELDRNGERLPGGSWNTVRLLLCSVNELTLTETGLWWNPESQQIERKEDTDLHVLANSLDGFLYPCVLDGMADVNHILYYTKTPKHPNEAFIQNILENEPPLACDKQEQGFANVLANAAGSELDLQLLTNVYAGLQERTAEEDGQLTLDKKMIRDVLEEAGLSQTRLDMLSSVYDKELGSETVSSANTHADQLNIKLPGITLTLKGESVGKVCTKVIDGRQCLVIEMDEAMYANGMELNQ